MHSEETWGIKRKIITIIYLVSTHTHPLSTKCKYDLPLIISKADICGVVTCTFYSLSNKRIQKCTSIQQLALHSTNQTYCHSHYTHVYLVKKSFYPYMYSALVSTLHQEINKELIYAVLDIKFWFDLKYMYSGTNT